MDREEFERMAPKLRESIVAMARRMAPDGDGAALADDVAQDTLLRLWNMRDRLDSYSSVSSLAMVMARNLTLDLLRRRSGRQAVSLEGWDAPDTTPRADQTITASEDHDRLHKVIDSLPSTQQAIIRMRHLEEMEIDEIAAIIGATPASVRVMLTRARARIRDIFLSAPG